MSQLPHVTNEHQERCDRVADDLWAAFGTREAGSLIQYRDFERITGASWRSHEGRAAINRFRKRLLADREIATRCEPSVGVRLLTHAEAATLVPQERTRKMYRQGGRLLKETEGAAAATNLGEHGRSLLARIRDEARRLRREAGRARREHEAAIQPTPTLPVRKAM